MSKTETVPQPKIVKPPKSPESFRGLPRSTIKVLKPGMFNPVEAIRSLREE
jgi:hypothetical protein